jgi:hypothetical protein
MEDIYNKVWRVKEDTDSHIHFYIAPSIGEVIRKHRMVHSIAQKLTIEALGLASDSFHYMEVKDA